MRMLKDVLLSCRGKLTRGGIEDADYEARCLVTHVTGYDRAALIAHGDEEVTEAQAELLNSFTKKRLTRYPLQYLLGEWSFMGFPLLVGEGVLIPRDDTEVCAGLALDYLKSKPRSRVFDLCAGSGAIAIALEKLGNAEVTAVELSGEAFEFLKKNIELNDSRVRALNDDVLTCHSEVPDHSLDLIISNPPYIISSELNALQPEVRFEPQMALDGGSDGLFFYNAIIRDWSRKLKSGGALVFELGEGQAEPVDALMKQHGFEKIRTEVDFGGCHRAIIGTML